jgi:hypothetical protein
MIEAVTSLLLLTDRLPLSLLHYCCCCCYTSYSAHCLQHLLAAACCPRMCETGASAVDTLIQLAEHIDLTGTREVPAKQSENDDAAHNNASGMLLILQLR